MRLGEIQTSTFIAGIAGTHVSGNQVVISSTGQLGIVASSARYKRDIRAMGARLAEIPLIHLSDGSGGTGIACAEAEAGLLLRHPTVVVGRQYLLDPVRVPAGAAALWLQLQEVPYAPRGDAAGELDTTHGWTEAWRSVRRLRRAGPELSVAATGLVGPPRDPDRPALAHRRLDPPGSGSRRRLRTWAHLKRCGDSLDAGHRHAIQQAVVRAIEATEISILRRGRHQLLAAHPIGHTRGFELRNAALN
jgi:hypothetical protein